MRYIRRKIVELDVKAFQKTILFIQEFQTEEVTYTFILVSGISRAMLPFFYRQ